MVFTESLNYVFGPILLLPPFLAILILSFLISLISVVITKYTTDQNVMKDLKDQLKTYQAEAKKLKDNPQAAMEVQKKAMDTNMKYMMHNMRATLFTFLPIILVFGWMSSHLAFAPIQPGEEFTMTLVFSEKGNNATITVPEGLTLTTNATKTAADTQLKYTLKAKSAGAYLVDFEVGGKTFSQAVVIGRIKEGITPEKSIGQNGLDAIRVDYGPLKVIVFPVTLPLFGEYFGWLGTYIILAILFSMLLRRMLKVH